MTAYIFKEILDHYIKRTEEILGVKAEEYATEDRLHNFKVAAEVQGTTPVKALGGMMAKHTVSIYDMIDSPRSYPRARWEEKITDHINYLILLAALIEDTGKIDPE